MEATEAAQLENIINTNGKKRSYYVFKSSNWRGNDSNIMKSTYMLMSRKPPKMLGTVLWLVDNVRGTLTRVWDLPFDIKLDPRLLDPNTPLEHVHDSMAGIEGSIVLS